MNKKTGIYIVADGIVLFTSTISIGAISITTAISKSFNVSMEEAMKLQYKSGSLGPEDTKKLFGAVINVLSGFKDEVIKVISYWRSHDEAQRQVESVVLSGRNANIPGFVEYLATNTHLTVMAANVWKNVCAFDHYVPPIPYEESLDYGVAIGLGL